MSNNHPNRNWRRKWQSVGHGLYKHAEGITVTCSTGVCVLCHPHPITLDTARQLSRLLKEANELWSEQKEISHE